MGGKPRKLTLPDGRPWFMERLELDPSRGCLMFRGATYKGTAFLRTPGGPVKKLARIVYEHAYGTQPRSVAIVQTCGSGACGELTHLKAGTVSAAILAGRGEGALNARKAACKRGHPFDDKNTYFDPAGRRRCRCGCWCSCTSSSRARAGPISC